MESITYTRAELDRFLAVPEYFGTGHGYGYSSGAGYDYGSGCGYGDAPGFGYEDGIGHGSGDGYGDGYGSGSGSGSGEDAGLDGYGSDDSYWKAINGYRIHYIDGVPTILIAIRGSYARGYIVNFDLSFEPCYIARVDNSFAHGKTLREARRDAMSKAMEEAPVEERIDAFVKAHPDLDAPYGDLFEWHHTLTGSCEMGRKEWCRANGYEPTDSITVRTFIEKTINNYGGDIIRQLAESYCMEA